jgi:hypothetical protein
MRFCSKVEHLKLKKDILLPNFPVPKEFQVHEDRCFKSMGIPEAPGF